MVFPIEKIFHQVYPHKFLKILIYKGCRARRLQMQRVVETKFAVCVAPSKSDRDRNLGASLKITGEINYAQSSGYYD
ncbi:MAG: hypothetical protein QNJ51_24475 [Calothrix sp. MO_167.B12]|nr:hypothetical protein [Calothrix sp. MO_167.B12]